MPELIAAITPEEWAQVPVSVLELIHELVRRMDKLEQQGERTKMGYASTAEDGAQASIKTALSAKWCKM